MSETKNKYADYFFDSVPAIQKASEDSIKTISASAEEFLTSTKSSINKNDTAVRPRSRFDVINPSDLFYDDRIVQNSEILDIRAKMTVDRIARNVNNSVGKKPVVKTSTKKKNVSLWDKLTKTGKEVVSAIVVGSIMLTGYVAAKGIDNISDKMNVNDYLEQYDEAYYDNKFAVNIGSLDANGDPYYDYDILGMGRDIAESEDPEASLYAIYSNTNYLKYDVTHGAFAAAKEVNPDVFGASKTFKEHAASLGCVDEDGNIDYKRYEEVTEAILLAKQALAENSASQVSVK